MSVRSYVLRSLGRTLLVVRSYAFGRSVVRSVVRSYVRSCTFRSYKNSASFSASWGTKWGTIFVRPKSARPNVRPNDRTYDRTTKSVRPNDQKRTTERPQYVGPNGHVNVRTYDQLKTHIECFLFGKTCCERFFSNFWLDIQWRNSHSQQQFVLNVGYPISSQKHVSGTSTLWSVSLRPKLTLISLIQTTKKKKTQKNTTNLLD